MSQLTPIKEKENDIIRFIDIDKDKSHFYTNIFVKDKDIVIKTPFLLKKPNKSDNQMDPKLESFDLTKYIYLIDY